MPPWLQLMLDSLAPLLWAALVFTIPLTLASFVLGLALGLLTAVARLFGPRPLSAVSPADDEPSLPPPAAAPAKGRLPPTGNAVVIPFPSRERR